MARKVFRRSVTTTSTSVSDLGEVGDERFEGGKYYRLVYTAAAQVDDGFLAWATADSSWASYQVVAATNTVPVAGVNDTGASIAASTYFWAMERGPLLVAAYDSDVETGQLGGSLTANTGLALNTDEGVVDAASTDVWNIARVGVANAAIDSTDGGYIWFQPSPLSLNS